VLRGQLCEGTAEIQRLVIARLQTAQRRVWRERNGDPSAAAALPGSSVTSRMNARDFGAASWLAPADWAGMHKKTQSILQFGTLLSVTPNPWSEAGERGTQVVWG
jgi:hypothetical protein